MVQSAIACPKCQTQMQDGYLVDETRVAHWHEGPPRRWLGMTMVGWAKKRLPITTYRCPACGYLESYAKAK
jgi:hypothetical protein